MMNLYLNDVFIFKRWSIEKYKKMKIFCYFEEKRIPYESLKDEIN